MKNTKTNLIKLFTATRDTLTRSAKLERDTRRQSELWTLALEYDVILTAMTDRDAFDDLCTIYDVK